jgi:hypothetical protein
LCKDIITRSQTKKDQLDTLYTEIRSHIKTANDVQALVPRIKELLDVGVKNDEQLIKLATVVQRLQSTQLEASGGDTAGLSDEEKEQLLEAVASQKIQEIHSEVKLPISSSLP